MFWCYTDTDWAGCSVTRRSTSGYCVFLGDNLLSWSAKSQVTLSCSSVEAEYRCVANVVAETAWIRNMLIVKHKELADGIGGASDRVCKMARRVEDDDWIRIWACWILSRCELSGRFGQFEVQKGDDQVTLLESIRHCFMPLVIPAAGGSDSVAATKILAPIERGHESVAEEDAYLESADPGEGTAMVRQSDEEVVTEQPKKIKKKRLTKQSNVLPAKRLRTDHPSLASGTEGKTLAGLEQIMTAGSRLLVREQSVTPSVAPQESESFMDLSAQASLQIHTTVGRYVYAS
ncbi:ribonuclease H-like domain-containing protein, partial [Tanacetum coccineum]